VVTSVRRTHVLPNVRKGWRVSERRACRIAGVNRLTLQYRSKRTDDPAVRARIKEIAAVRVRYGYRRITVLLRRDGWRINHKRVHRIYPRRWLSDTHETATSASGCDDPTTAPDPDRAQPELGHGLHARRARRRH
jgi:transposase InsO family protein